MFYETEEAAEIAIKKQFGKKARLYRVHYHRDDRRNCYEIVRINMG